MVYSYGRLVTTYQYLLQFVRVCKTVYTLRQFLCNFTGRYEVVMFITMAYRQQLAKFINSLLLATRLMCTTMVQRTGLRNVQFLDLG